MNSDICYEQIDGDYWYATYLGTKIIIMKSNGYINATKLCTDGGKQFKNWLRCLPSQEVLAYYNAKLNQPTFPTDVTQNLTLEGGLARIRADLGANANSTILPTDVTQNLTLEGGFTGIPVDLADNAKLILPTMTIRGGDNALRRTYIHPRIIHYVATG